MSYEIIRIDTANGIPAMEAHIRTAKIKHLFIDTETTGLDPFTDELVLLQILADTKI
jgi:ribonuclease D